MIRIAILSGAALAAFVVALLAWFPMSLALAMTDARASGLDWSRAAGPVWNGVVEDARLQRRRLGDMEAKLRFWPLLAGRVSAEIEINAGGLSGQGVVARTSRGRIIVADARLTADLARAEGVDPRLRGRPGSLLLEMERAVFEDGRCVEAVGTAWTDALVHGDPRADWTGPPLAGEAFCEGDDLVVRLDGRDAAGEYRAEARVGPDRAFRVNARVRSAEPDLRAFLPLLGFEREGDAYVYAWPREGA